MDIKIYTMQVTIEGRLGGIDGPTPDLEDLKNRIPDDDYDGMLVQIMESEEKYGISGEPKAILDWCWKTDEWVPSERKISIVFGATCPPLAEQLADFDLDEEKISHWQKDANAITRLSVRGILNSSDTERARNKLTNCIVRNE